MQKKRREEMKKISILTVALIAVLAIGVGTASAQTASIGYQGMFGSGSNVLSGLSFRGWADAFGYEGTVFYGRADADGGDDASIWALDVQGMFCLIAKENSKLYVGAHAAYGQWDIDIADDNFWWAGPLVGAQYSFQELPELTFNWEVAYDFIDTGDLDVMLSGLNTTVGVHYAF
jgi:hypothetical protein